jgi:hypothetical protein
VGETRKVIGKKERTGPESVGANTTDTARRRAIVVLGFHRSGTSALTRVLSLCGASLPAHLMTPNHTNAREFFESDPIFRLHEEILSSLGSTWHDLSPLPEAWMQSDLAQSYVFRMAKVVGEEFGTAPLFVLKDPRICRLVPFWLAVFAELNIEPLFVLPIRNPLEVAASLEQSESIDQQKGLLLWLSRSLQAERDSRNYSRSFVEYDSLLKDWRGTVKKIGSDLDLTFPSLSRRSALETDAFLSDEARHQSPSTAKLAVREDVLDWAKMAFEWLSFGASGKKIPAKKIDALHFAFVEAERAFGPILAKTEFARETADAAARSLEEEVSTLGADRERLESEVVPLSNESTRLKTQLKTREEQVGELIDCIKLMLVWIASRAPGNRSSSEELQILIQAMDSADSDSIAETAVEGLRRYQDSVESAESSRELAPRHVGLSIFSNGSLSAEREGSRKSDGNFQDAILALKSRAENAEKDAEAREEENFFLRAQAKEKGAVLDQTITELVGLESKFHEVRADREATEKKQKQAEVRIEEQSGSLLKEREEVAEQERRVASLDSERADLNRRVAGLRERAAGLQSEQAVLQRDLEARDKAILAIESEKQAMTGQLTGLREQTADLESEKQALAQQLTGLQESAATLEERVREQSRLAADSGARTEVREAEIQALQNRTEQLLEDRLQIRERLSIRDRELASLENSRTWRMTLPLRRLGGLARRARIGILLRPLARLVGLRK